MGRRFKNLLLLAILLLASAGATAGLPPVYYLGIEHGLSNNEVNSIYQSRAGYMWIGTFDGLNRYDGYGFKIFKKRIGDPLSLVNNRVQDIAEDAANNLWVATMGGVSIYSSLHERFTTLHYFPLNTHQLQQAGNTTVIKRDSSDDMLIGTVKEGLLVYDQRTGKTGQIPLQQGSRQTTAYQVTSIEVDPESRVWLFVDEVGLCRYNRQNRTVQPVTGTLKQSVCIKADKSGNLWLGSPSGLYKYNIQENVYQFKSLTQAITNLHCGRQGDLWVSTDGGGVYILDVADFKIIHHLIPNGKESLTSMAIKGVCEDNMGRFWIATLRGGINIIDARRNLFKTLFPGILKNDSDDNYFISSFCEDDSGNLWIGTDGNGLNYWDRKKGKYINFEMTGKEGLTSNKITGILKDRYNNFWIATWGGGVNRYNNVTNRFEHFPCINQQNGHLSPNAWKLYEDAGGNLWVSTYADGGLFRFNRTDNRFELFDDSIGNVLTIAEDGKQNLWVGTDDKLIRIDRTTKKHLSFHIGYRVRSVLEKGEGLLWVGTEGGGLLLFNIATGKYIRFTESQGLPNNAVLNIFRSSGGQLWLSTFYGLSKFDPTEIRFYNFSASDGLQCNQFSYSAALKLKSGELVFGGIKGFNLFLPEEISVSRNKLPVLISGIRINNTPLSDSANFQYARDTTADAVGSLVLPYNKASLSFDYVALEYSTPDKVNFAYFLEGWDKSWTDAGKIRTVNYSRLEEGNYTLHVKAKNSEGEWGDETQFKIVVLPPWYRTWWAYCLYIILASGGIYLYILYERRQADLAYEVRLAQIETKTEKELNEKKLSFFTNITHELKTPLTLIVNPVKELLGKAEDSTKADLNLVYRNANRLLTLVDQLMLFRTADNETSQMHIRPLNLYELCRDTFECFLQIAANKNIRYEFECASKELEIFGDPQKLEIILFNLISNAFKFTPSHGSILLRIRENEEDVEIFINDTGCGINENIKNNLFEKYNRGENRTECTEMGFGIGLYLVKRFIDCHKGTVNCMSSADQGTSFHIKLRKGIWFDTALNAPLGYAPVKARPEQLPIEKLAEEPDIETFGITEKKSLLIVDDNMELRQYLKNVFAGKFIIYEAADGVQGFDLTLQHEPDIVISDVQMSEISGLELLRKIKHHPNLNHIPVILLSGLSSADSQLQGIESGADNYFTKPFDRDLLVARINSILENSNALQQFFREKITLRENNQKISATYKVFLETCIAIIEENLDKEELNPQLLARRCNMSYSNLYKKVKSISGLSVNAFIRSIRLRKAALLILSTNTNVNEAAFQVGIYDIKYFRKQFKNLYGMNPSEYIKKYRHSFSKEFNLIVRRGALQ